MSSTTTASKPSSKSAKRSKIVILRLSPDKLADFPSDVKPTSSTSIKPDPSPSVQPPDSNEKTSESNSTPIPPNGNDETDPNSLAPPKVDTRRKRGGGTITGRKRAPPAIDPNAPPRERGRPGPKKKPRLPDGTIDRSQDPTRKDGAGNTTSTHKLGPKANTGAINAGLRALDRTGKPCRKWERKGIQIKSFTGTLWDMPSWKAPTRSEAFAGDVKSDSTGSSEVKMNGSSVVQSERSNSGVDGADVVMANGGLESSPAPPVAA